MATPSELLQRKHSVVLCCFCLFRLFLTDQYMTDLLTALYELVS